MNLTISHENSNLQIGIWHESIPSQCKKDEQQFMYRLMQ